MGVSEGQKKKNNRLLLSAIAENLESLCVHVCNFEALPCTCMCFLQTPPLHPRHPQHIPPVPQMGSQQATNQKQNSCDSRISELAVLTLVS